MFGGKDEDPLPMTIQNLEKILAKRTGVVGAVIGLRIPQDKSIQEYVLIPKEDWMRIKRVVESVEKLIGKPSSEEDHTVGKLRLTLYGELCRSKKVKEGRRFLLLTTNNWTSCVENTRR